MGKDKHEHKEEEGNSVRRRESNKNTGAELKNLPIIGWSLTGRMR